MVKLLLKEGAKVDVKDKDGKEPISFAKDNNKEIIKLFEKTPCGCIANVMISGILRVIL